MAEITITIPDAYAARVVDAFAETYNWDTETGLTKAQFAKKQVAEFIKEVFKNYEAKQAAILAGEASLLETGQVNIN